MSLVLGAVAWSAAPRFYPDDPHLGGRRPRLRRLEGRWRSRTPTATICRSTRSAGPGERRDVRALNVNTVDEVPDSSWFTNRIGRRDDGRCRRGRGARIGVERVALDGWVVSGGKSAGVQPGFRMTDPGGPDLSDRGRSALESRAGQRRRDHRHRVLSRDRVQHGRRLPGGDRSRRPGDLPRAPPFAIR